MEISEYLTKENYIVRDNHPDLWRNHPNGQIIKHYSDFITGNVLDFGCNNGSCTFLIGEIEHVVSTLGYDINKVSIDMALTLKNKLEFDKVDFQYGNLCESIFSKKFDTIISFHTLEHIYPKDINCVVSKFYENLNEEGYVLISVPYDKCYEDKTHVNFFTEINLNELFKFHGFESIECFKDDRWNEQCLLTGLFKKK